MQPLKVFLKSLNEVCGRTESEIQRGKASNSRKERHETGIAKLNLVQIDSAVFYQFNTAPDLQLPAHETVITFQNPVHM